MDNNIKSVITCDLDGKVETFSEGAEKLFGYSSKEVVGKLRVLSLIHISEPTSLRRIS